MTPARARTRTTRSGVERTNHEATAPPSKIGRTLSTQKLLLKKFEIENSHRSTSDQLLLVLSALAELILNTSIGDSSGLKQKNLEKTAACF